MLCKSLARNAFLVRATAWGAILLLGAALPSAAGDAPAAGREILPAAEYLPPDDPAWEDVEALWNRGGLPGLPIHARPLPRLDVARALASTLDRRPDLARSVAARRLVRELAFELRALGADHGYPETHPFREWREDGVLLRGRLETRLSAVTRDDVGVIPEGTRATVSGRAWMPGGVFLRAELSVEKILDEVPIGDAIVKNSPWYLAVEEAYVAFRPGGFEVAAGLLEHRWGPGATGTLLLSDAAISYPSIFWARTLGGRARFVALTGALHAPEGRWFSAHRLEVALGRRVRVGVHEAAVYRSEGLDLAYATGLIPYTLVQRLLDRTWTPPPPGEAADGPTPSDFRNNVIVGADATWRVGRGWRLDGELMVDDLATEDSKQPDRLGFLGGVSWAGTIAGRATDARVEVAKVYRWSYATFYDANLVLDGTPLGYGPGPDVEAARVRIERDVARTWRAGAGVDVLRRGDSRVGLAWDPTTDETRGAGATLTDPVERRLFPHVLLSGTWRDVARLRARIGWERVENLAHVAGADDDAFRTETEVRLRW